MDEHGFPKTVLTTIAESNAELLLLLALWHFVVEAMQQHRYARFAGPIQVVVLKGDDPKLEN
eukprot:1198951-Pleurochrysis_carterae.AAC.1